MKYWLFGIIAFATVVTVAAIAAYINFQSLEKLKSIENGVTVGFGNTSEAIDGQRQSIADMTERLVELEERAATPHDMCWWLRDEQEYAADEFNKPYSNNIYKQTLWSNRMDMLTLLAATWNCPLQSSLGLFHINLYPMENENEKYPN